MPVKLKASDLVRTLTSKEIFVPSLNRSIAQNDFEWEFKYEQKQSDDAWHPSGDCTPSLTTLYHIAKDRSNPDSTPNVPSLSLRKTFMVGHFWHQWLQFHAVKAGICDPDAIERKGKNVWKYSLYEKETPWSYAEWEPEPFCWAKGSADVAPAMSYKEKWIIDFKTMNPTDFKAENPPERFAEKWECQMNIYMDFFDIDKTCIIAIDKLTGEMKEFYYRRNQPLIDAIYEKWKIISECLRDDIEPPQDEVIELPLKGISE